MKNALDSQNKKENPLQICFRWVLLILLENCIKIQKNSAISAFLITLKLKIEDGD